MIISRLVSGLGNQLFQYAIGRQLSLKHGVPLKLDTSFFETQSLRTYVLSNYKVEASIASESELERIDFWQKNPGLLPKVYRRWQRSLPRSRRRYFEEREWWSYDDDLMNVSSKVYLNGYWQHYKYYLDLNPQIFNELTLKVPSAAAASLKEEITQNSKAVSIHIRRGDYVTDSLMGLLPLGYYNAATGHMNKAVGNPFYYVFSDDLNWAKDNLKLNSQVSFVELPAGANYDYVELDLMSACSHHIIANSSFSWWGAYLNRKPGKIVVAPQNWVSRPEINNRTAMQFPSWIKM